MHRGGDPTTSGNPANPLSLLSQFREHRASAKASMNVASRILLWWALPLCALGVGGTLLFKAGLAAVALTVGDGYPMTRLHVNIGVPAYFATHILTGTVALLVGPWQLSAFLRRKMPNAHRGLGRFYLFLVVVSALTSFVLSPRLDTFGTAYLRMISGMLWLAFTLRGVLAIRARDVAAHRRWMLRSYAFTFMGLTFLAYTWVGDQLQIAMPIKYPLVLWLTFLTNVLAVEAFLARTSQRRSRNAPRSRKGLLNIRMARPAGGENR